MKGLTINGTIEDLRGEGGGHPIGGSKRKCEEPPNTRKEVKGKKKKS